MDDELFQEAIGDIGLDWSCEKSRGDALANLLDNAIALLRDLIVEKKAVNSLHVAMLQAIENAVREIEGEE